MNTVIVITFMLVAKDFRRDLVAIRIKRSEINTIGAKYTLLIGQSFFRLIFSTKVLTTGIVNHASIKEASSQKELNIP